MTPPNSVIIDAGPALTFTAANQHQFLVDVVAARQGRLLTPETVVTEVVQKRGRQFAQCAKRMGHLVTTGAIEVLADDIQDEELAKLVQRVTGMNASIRLAEPRDLGETMVIAHALKRLAVGETAFALIDEWRGQRLAKDHGVPFISTEGVLRAAVAQRRITDRGEMREFYETLRQYDDGLVHIENTTLLERALYRLPHAF